MEKVYPEYEEVAESAGKPDCLIMKLGGIFLDTLYTERYNEESNRKQE